MDYIKPFLIGGSVIAGAKYVAAHVGPTWAPIIGAMPTGIVASYFLSKKDKEQYYKSYMINALVLFLNSILIYYLIQKFQTNIDIDTVSAICLVIWILSSYVSIKYFIKYV